MQSQTKVETFIDLEKFRQILFHENMKAVPDKSPFSLTRVKFLGHIIEKKHYNSPKSSHRCDPKTPNTFK